MIITLITPTCDQPTGIELCEVFMQRQTLYGRASIQWLVVDDGLVPATLTMEQTHILRAREPDCLPAQSFCRNLLAATPRITGDIIVFIEHDDHYAPTHLETIVAQLQGQAQLAGDDKQRYYNVKERRWRVFNNVGSSLCQTAMRRALLPRFESVVRKCLASEKFGIDRTLWDATPAREQSLQRTDTVVGIKGLPGRPGIGVGHRPSGPAWTDDQDLAQLQAWLGADASLYAPFARPPLPEIAAVEARLHHAGYGAHHGT